MRALLAFACMALAATAYPARADDVAGAAPSPAPTLDTDFLLLPSFDIERVESGSKPAPVRVGDDLQLHLVGPKPQGLTQSFQSLLLTLPDGDLPEGASAADLDLDKEGWEITPATAAQGAPNAQDTKDSEFRLTATPVKPGNLTIPSLALRTADGKAVARTNPFHLTVSSAIRSDDQKPQEADPPAPPSRIAFPWWFVAGLVCLGVAAVGLLAIALIRAIRRRSPKPKVVDEGPPKPEDEVALAALNELEKRKLCFSGQFKIHYFAISEILKAYIGRRYGFAAPECTTGEMLAQFEANTWIPAAQIDRLDGAFQKLDRVKFTDHVPESMEGQQLLDMARQFVFSTRRIQVAAVLAQGQAGQTRQTGETTTHAS